MSNTVVSSAVWPGLQLLSFTATAAQKLRKPVCKALGCMPGALPQHGLRPEAAFCWPRLDAVRVKSPSLSSCIQAAVPGEQRALWSRGHGCLLLQDQFPQLLLPGGTLPFSNRSKSLCSLCRSFQLLYWCCDQLKRGSVYFGPQNSGTSW